MNQLLISFCNVFPRGLALGIYDYEKEQFGWIDSSIVNENIMGVNGMSANNKKYHVITQIREGGSSGLIVVNNDLKLERSYNLVETIDAHSLISYGNGFLVADTGKNRIVKITLENAGTIKETEFWRYNDDGKDTVHVNSLAMIGDRVFVSLFGTKISDNWREVKTGKIIDVATNTIICDNLYHPHSLTIIDGMLYWLESGTGTIHRYSQNKGHEILLKLGGYLRGLTFDKKYLYVASSGHRRKSRSTGVTNISQFSSKEESRSWLYKINKKNRSFERKELTHYGTEIYDLLLLETKYDVSKYENPITKRLWKYEDSYSNLAEKTTYIDNQFRSLIREYVNNANWEKALTHIEQILDASEDAELEYLLAFILQSKQQTPDKSLRYYDLALKHGFDEYWVRYNRGQLYASLGNFDLSIVDLEKALMLNPDDPNIQKLISDVKNNMNDNLSV